MEIKVDPKSFFSKKHWKILEDRAKKDRQPVEVIAFRLCNLLMSQAKIHKSIEQFHDGKLTPELKQMSHEEKLFFIRYRKYNKF